MGRRGESKTVRKTGGTMSNIDLKRYADAVQLDLAHLLQLLGGTEEDRERYFENVRGITSRGEYILASSQLKAVGTSIKQVTEHLTALNDVGSLQRNQRV